MTVTFPALSQAGRLGNQLWQVAATLGLAHDRSEDVSFPPWDYQPFFSAPAEWFTGRAGTDATTLVPYMDPRARPYLQDYRLFERVADEVRQYLSPSELARKELGNARFDWYRELPRPRVALHVRRGDNVTHPPGYHPLRSIEYYRRSLESVEAASVVVFSDDISWCRANLTNALGVELDYFRGVARPREYADRLAYETAPILDWVDLFLMAEAELHVLSNSTYAWWGAFLSDDPSPIYPSNWFGWRIAEYTDASLMFPPAWREVHDDTQGGVRC
jgi:hypothetical protein